MLSNVVSFYNHKLCYCGQQCHKIPEIIIKSYGQKTLSLDLSYNQLVTLEGLEAFSCLKELILDNNTLSDALSFPYLPSLQTLSLNKNNIYNLEGLITKVKQKFPNITFLSLLGNRACPNELSGKENDEDDYQRYRYYVLFRLPELKFLDSSKIGKNEKKEATRRGKFMNVIKPKESINEENNLETSAGSNFRPLPNYVRNTADHIGMVTLGIDSLS